MIKKSKENDKKGFSKTQQEQLQELLSNTFDSDDSEISTNEAKELETVKIILASTLNNKYLESLTNLSKEELDDINDALYLVHYYDNPLILVLIEHRLKLLRSLTKEPQSLLKVLTEIAGKGLSNSEMDMKKGIFGNRFKS